MVVGDSGRETAVDWWQIIELREDGKLFPTKYNSLRRCASRVIFGLKKFGHAKALAWRKIWLKKVSDGGNQAPVSYSDYSVFKITTRKFLLLSRVASSTYIHRWERLTKSHKSGFKGSQEWYIHTPLKISKTHFFSGHPVDLLFPKISIRWLRAPKSQNFKF